MTDSNRSAAMVQQLREAVSLLAASKDQQKVYLSSLGVWPSLDELGLEYDDIYPIVPSLEEAGYVSEGAEQTLNRLSSLLSRASGEYPDFWSADSLDGPMWQEVRALARHALSELEL